eukprot:TRINITY_DN23284_c0_g1_i1.p1 TRINITY_DN23284_c0_g1~~TRINITY_DN23284_c0_g1_i1.p1  ORF type:complete len:160 (+),score=11.63 TRINITY_DN23284_c0_g1_i1:713-1192(+)
MRIRRPHMVAAPAPAALCRPTKMSSAARRVEPPTLHSFRPPHRLCRSVTAVLGPPRHGKSCSAPSLGADAAKPRVRRHDAPMQGCCTSARPATQSLSQHNVSQHSVSQHSASALRFDGVCGAVPYCVSHLGESHLGEPNHGAHNMNPVPCHTVPEHRIT